MGKHYDLEFRLNFETYIYAFRNVCKTFLMKCPGRCCFISEHVTQAWDDVHHLRKDVGSGEGNALAQNERQVAARERLQDTAIEVERLDLNGTAA